MRSAGARPCRPPRSGRRRPGARAPFQPAARPGWCRARAAASRERLRLELERVPPPRDAHAQALRRAAPAVAGPAPLKARAVGRHLAVRAVGARSDAQGLEALGRQRERDARVACEAQARRREPRDRGQPGERDAGERRADQRFDHGEAGARPGWFTITLRVRAPAASAMVAFSAPPSPPNSTRPRAGRAAKPTPGGSQRVESNAPARSRVSQRARPGSKRTSMDASLESAMPRASLSAVATSRAAPASRAVWTRATSWTAPTPASTMARPRPATTSSSVNPCARCISRLLHGTSAGGTTRAALACYLAPPADTSPPVTSVTETVGLARVGEDAGVAAGPRPESSYPRCPGSVTDGW